MSMLHPPPPFDEGVALAYQAALRALAEDLRSARVAQVDLAARTVPDWNGISRTWFDQRTESVHSQLIGSARQCDEAADAVAAAIQRARAAADAYAAAVRAEAARAEAAAAAPPAAAGALP